MFVIIVSMFIFICVLGTLIDFKQVQVDYLIPMKMIEKDKHFLPEYQDKAEKNIVTPKEIVGSRIFGDVRFKLDINGNLHQTETSDEKSKISAEDDLKVTQIFIRADRKKEYTKFNFLTNMNFDKSEVLGFRQGIISDFENDRLPPIEYFDYLEAEKLSASLTSDLVGLCVVKNDKDITSQGTLKINDRLISWRMTDLELKKLNSSDDIYSFFVYQKKPKEVFR